MSEPRTTTVRADIEISLWCPANSLHPDRHYPMEAIGAHGDHKCPVCHRHVILETELVRETHAQTMKKIWGLTRGT